MSWSGNMTCPMKFDQAFRDSISMLSKGRTRFQGVRVGEAGYQRCIFSTAKFVRVAGRHPLMELHSVWTYSVILTTKGAAAWQL